MKLKKTTTELTLDRLKALLVASHQEMDEIRTLTAPLGRGVPRASPAGHRPNRRFYSEHTGEGPAPGLGREVGGQVTALRYTTDEQFAADLRSARLELIYGPGASSPGGTWRTRSIKHGGVEAARDTPWIWADEPEACPEGRRLQQATRGSA